MADAVKRKNEYHDFVYNWVQIRDCVKGSNFVKRKQEMYLPMPSGMQNINVAPSTSQPNSLRSNSELHLSMSQMPWYHSNPAYRAYLQRARFPDIAGTVLRGMVGMVTKVEPEIKLNGSISNLEDMATVCGKSLEEAYGYSIGEVLQTGKLCYVLDVNSKSEFRIALYSAERNTDWEYEVIDGEKILTRCTFVETYSSDDTEEVAIEYKIVDGIAQFQRMKNGKPDGEEEVIMYRGRVIRRLPIFFAGSTNNEADIDIIPLMGISDIALTIYRKDADLAQAQYMTCNPTLFIFGINEDSTPKIIGSTVTVTISNPNAKAEYPRTDTSALDHMQSTIKDLFDEAIASGAQILGVGKKAAESGEALSLREASNAATLVTVVELVSKAIRDVLEFAADWSGSGEVVFQQWDDFAETDMTAQETTALVSAWFQGAISHDTLLDNLRDVNVVASDVTNEEERKKIASEREDIGTNDDPGTADDPGIVDE